MIGITSSGISYQLIDIFSISLKVNVTNYSLFPINVLQWFDYYFFLLFHSIFGKRVEDLQTQLYQKDPGIAMDLMLTEQIVWDIQVSPLESAFDNAMLDVIAHSCAQRRLNKIWYKSIGSSLGGFWKVIWNQKGLFIILNDNVKNI